MGNRTAISLEYNGWTCGMYETAGTASKTFAAVSAVHSGVQRFSLAWHLRRLSQQLSTFLDNLYLKCDQASAKPSSDKVASKEDIAGAILTLEYLHETIRRLYTTAKQKQLTNNSLMAGSLATIERRSEELLDIADWLKASVTYTSSQLDSLYESARADLASGEVFELSQVK